jgi:serine phosphatase RsbU (regulator of sigma subunit)
MAGAHRFFLGALPYVVMAAVVAVELSHHRYMGFLCLLSLGPALASVSRRALPTALIGAEAVALSLGISWYDQFFRMPHGIVPTVLIAGVALVCVMASAGRQRREDELRLRERELSDLRTVAEMAQAVLQRPAPREVPGAEIAVRYMSATAAARIGGDLYEVISTPTWVRLIVGDVQGKGIGAVRTASMVIGAFREAVYDAPDLTQIAARIEQSMSHQAAEQEFVTAVIAEMSPGSSTIEILNCGHPSPLLVRDGEAALADSPDPCPPLGLSSLAEGPRVADTWPFGTGDQILFYTDGISEARDARGDFFPLLPLCGPILAGNDPEAALDLVKDQVVRHVGHTLTDDAAMLLVRSTALAGYPADAISAPLGTVPAQGVSTVDAPGASA